MRNPLAKKPLKERILDDKRVLKIFVAKSEGIYSLDTRELMEELTDLHQSRAFSNMPMKTFIPSMQKNLVNWQIELNATRSRVTTIMMTCFKIKRDLAEQIKNTKGYILTTYSEELKSEVGNTITARKDYVDQLLESFRKLDYKLESVIELSKILINDLSESKWNANGVVEALKMQVGRD